MPLFQECRWGVVSSHNGNVSHAKLAHSNKNQKSLKTLNHEEFENQIDKSLIEVEIVNQQKKYFEMNANTIQTLGNPSPQPK